MTQKEKAKAWDKLIEMIKAGDLDIMHRVSLGDNDYEPQSMISEDELLSVLINERSKCL